MLKFATKYEKFWKWFRLHEDEIFNFDADRERIFDKLAANLHHVHRDLTFEFSGAYDGKREFIVSAGGIKSAFPEVVALVRDAPILPRWTIIAFRQRKGTPPWIRFGETVIETNCVFFDYVPAGDRIDLTIFLEGLANASPNDLTGLKTVGYLLLDATVGEYDVETKVAGIQFVDASAFPGRRRISLLELPRIIDGLPSTVQ